LTLEGNDRGCRHRYWTKYLIFLNTVENQLHLQTEFKNPEVVDQAVGNRAEKAILMLLKPARQNGIDVLRLPAGWYQMELLEPVTLPKTEQEFIKL